MKTLGEQVKEFRDAKGWKATRLAEAIRATRMPGTAKTSRQSIEGLEEAGNRQPRFIAALAKVMDTTVDDMLARAGLAGRGKESADAAPVEDLHPDEQALLAAYRELPLEVRAAVLRCAAADTSGFDSRTLGKDQETLRTRSKQPRQKATKGFSGKR